MERTRGARRVSPSSDPAGAVGIGEGERRLEDLLRSQRTMVLTRFVAVPWAVVEVLTRALPPYPPGGRQLGVALAAGLGLGNVGVWLVSSRVRTAGQARALAVAGLGLDLLVACAFVLLHTFAHTAALWAVLFILPLEGAILFNLRGAVATWAAVTAFYVGRELWGSSRYGYLLSWNSITFRMGLALLIALVAGLMARNLLRERQRLATALAQLHVALALQERLAVTDELTGLHNRRGFITLGQQQLVLARRLDLDATLVFADVDEMKAINDRFGHAEGDEALRAVADALRGAFRRSDLIARIGGDEFCVLQIGGRDVRLTRLREAAEQMAASPQRPYRLTLSVGTARYAPDELSSMEELLEQADGAMYEDKRRGRTAAPLVLMVEDDPSLRGLADVMFEGDFELITTGTGEEALVLAATARPELIVLDLTLPDLSGMEVARRLRSAPATSAIPLLMLTATHDEACEAESLRAGVDDYVRKPFDEEVLRARMRNVLRHSTGPARH